MDPSTYGDKTSPSAFYSAAAMGNSVCYPIHFNTLLYNPMNSYSFMPHPLFPMPPLHPHQQEANSHLDVSKSAETLSKYMHMNMNMSKFYMPPTTQGGGRRPLGKFCIPSPTIMEDVNNKAYGVVPGSGDTTDSGLARTSPVSGGCSSEKECYVSSPGTEMEEPDSSGKCSTDVVEQKAVIIPRWTCDSSQPPVCPLCSRTMLPSEMDEHFNCEVEKLDELMRKKDWLSQEESNPDQSILRHPHFHDTEKKCPEYRKETYLRVRNNRISRLGGCNSRTKRPYFDEHKNPWKLHRPNPLCSPKQENLSDESSTQSGHQSMLMLELTVQQLAHRTESRTDLSAENFSPEKNLSNYQRPSQHNVEGFDDQNKSDIADSSCNGFNNLESGISSFPESLQRQHGDNRSDENPCSSAEIKCHVCSESYKKPVVSVCCWHVHCETCWLKALGSKRVCPKCDTITSPNDLRKIHL